MARPSSGLARPERFYAAAAYAGFGGLLSSSSSSSVALVSRFQDDVALLLYGLYQQVFRSQSLMVCLLIRFVEVEVFLWFARVGFLFFELCFRADAVLGFERSREDFDWNIRIDGFGEMARRDLLL